MPTVQTFAQPLESPAESPFWRVSLVLFVLAVAGSFALLPFVTTLEHAALAAAVARSHRSLTQVLAASVAQIAVVSGIAAVLGLWAARKLHLRTPLISALVTGRRPPSGTLPTLALSFVLGVAVALTVIPLDRWVFAPIPSVARLMSSVQHDSIHATAWQGFLASFYGAFDEEIELRLGFMSCVALGLRTFVRKFPGMQGGSALPASVFWFANILTAVAFGLAHLPATAALAPLSLALVIRAVVLNGAVGLLCGMLFRRYGLEWAMVCHFGADMIFHVVAAT